LRLLLPVTVGTGLTIILAPPPAVQHLYRHVLEHQHPLHLRDQCLRELYRHGLCSEAMRTHS
jgi:hypothetical protein